MINRPKMGILQLVKMDVKPNDDCMAGYIKTHGIAQKHMTQAIS